MLRRWKSAKVCPRVAIRSNTPATASGQARRSSVQVSVTRVPPPSAGSKRYSQVAIGPRSTGRRSPMARTRNAKRSPGSAAVTVQRVVHDSGPRVLRPSKTVPTRVPPAASRTTAPRFSGLQRPISVGSLTCA